VTHSFGHNPDIQDVIRVPVQANNYLLLRYKASMCSNLIARKLPFVSFSLASNT